MHEETKATKNVGPSVRWDDALQEMRGVVAHPEEFTRRSVRGPGTVTGRSSCTAGPDIRCPERWSSMASSAPSYMCRSDPQIFDAVRCSFCSGDDAVPGTRRSRLEPCATGWFTAQRR
jgi:hypothetical protein